MAGRESTASFVIFSLERRELANTATVEKCCPCLANAAELEGDNVMNL